MLTIGLLDIVLSNDQYKEVAEFANEKYLVIKEITRKSYMRAMKNILGRSEVGKKRIQSSRHS